MVIDNITAWYFLTRGGESINVLNPDSENANLKNRLINALFGFYLLQYTIVVIARQYTSHNNDLTYAITYIDIGWFGLLSILYLAGFISALMLETPRNKYLIKSFAILLTTIITSLGGAYLFGLNTSTSILITYSSITLVIVGYYHTAQVLLLAVYAMQVAIYIYSGDITLSNLLMNDVTLSSTVSAENSDRSTIISLLAHIIGPAGLGYILNYALNTFIQNIEQLNYEAKNDIERLNEITTRDSLTGLKGRQSLVEVIGEARSTAAKKDLQLILLIYDLDNIKSINQRYGHIAGDLVILHFSKIIQENIDWDTWFFRLGGDEFIGLHIVERKNTKLINYLREAGTVKHLSHGTSRIQYKANIGAYNATKDEHISMIIAKADNALRKAKITSMNSFQELTLTHHLGEWDEHNTYSDIQGNANAEIIEGQLSEKSIKEAILNNEIIFRGQPIVDCQKEKVIGVEAIIQWFDLENKIIPIEHYFETYKKFEWQDPYFQIINNARKEFISALNGSSSMPVHFSINPTSFIEHVTSSGLINDEILSNLKLLENCVFGITRLNTYTPKIIGTNKYNGILKRLSTSGLKIALDDFGSSNDSFSSLAAINVDILKIDKEIIREIDKSPKKQEICKSIVNLCKTLEIQVCAKGVENSAESKALQDIGIHIQQGVFWHEPMTASEFKRYKPL
jgi:diguanylate cyclase (GGDEF)-like protein